MSDKVIKVVERHVVISVISRQNERIKKDEKKNIQTTIMPKPLRLNG